MLKIKFSTRIARLLIPQNNQKLQTINFVHETTGHILFIVMIVKKLK